MDENMSKEEMVKEAVEEAKAKAEQDVDEAVNPEQDAECEAEADSAEEVIEESEEFNDDEQDAESSEEAQSESEEVKEKQETGPKKRFGRRNKKDKKDEKIEELTDRLTRQMAEFDNFRKRTEKEKAQMYEIGAKDVIEKILPVVDNFERGLASVPEEERSNPVMDGMEKIYKQLMTTLEGIGVQPIEAVGQEFNPDFHNAVMHVEDEELGENIIAEELQRGYMYRDSVVRHSMVKVAN